MAKKATLTKKQKQVRQKAREKKMEKLQKIYGTYFF